MKNLIQMARKPFFSPAARLSKIILYPAESAPLILLRQAFGARSHPDPAPPKNHRQILRSEILKILKFDWALKQLPKDFQESFYANDIRTPLNTLWGEDLEVVEEKSQFLSKSLLARKI
jgi:hypothetical protein